EPALPEGARPARQRRRRPRGGAAADAGAAPVHRRPAAALAGRAAGRGRGTEPGRPRRPRRLRRGDDEPRGSRPRHARLHDLRRPPRRRRRSADPLRPAAAADRPPCGGAGEADRRGDPDPARSVLPGRDDPRYRRSLTIARRAPADNAFLNELPEAEPGLEELVAPAAEGDPRPIDPVLRALDILISAAILLVLSPLLALIAAAIAISSGRPVLYRGARVGRAGHLFWMYKFR